jgi:hemoglobin
VNALFDRVRGDQFFVDLVELFYEGVAGDPLLRPLYPEDLTEPKHHLALFLAQYWGGPPVYNELRGHPRLRMRHAPFVIGPAERDAWLRHMGNALDTMAERVDLAETDVDELHAYFTMAAGSLMNAP